jgi:nucleoside-triphosphatase THEP1
MRRIRTTLTVDERLLRAARIEAAREGKRVYEVIEEALRDRYDLRAAVAAVRRADAPPIDEDGAMELAVSATREAHAGLAARQAG